MRTQGTIELSAAGLAADVRSGLSRAGQKELPSKYFYDDVGSALFETISLLPEYGLTRADERLLRRHAEAIVERLPPPVLVAELGSGNAKKTRWLLEAFCLQQATTYFPIEISRSALAVAKLRLSQIGCVSVDGFEKEYLDGLAAVGARRKPGQLLLVLFLGSTIGNFGREAGLQFLRQIRENLAPGDALLLGTDLEKPVPQLVRAYDDSLGVTAAFNLNLLARINRELDANFDLNCFTHLARYNTQERRVEMHLRSAIAQRVEIPKAEITVDFRGGETIWTESSHKYQLEEVNQMAGQSGFRPEAVWVDDEWPFAENLWFAE